MTNPVLRHHVFVDTSAFYAIFDRSDGHHTQAAAILRRLARERWNLVSSNLVLAESHGLMLSRRGRVLALRFLQEFYVSGPMLIRVNEDDEIVARAIIERYQDKDFSLTDATSFAIMERLGIEQAFSFDTDFAQFGFVTLQP